MDNTKLVTPDEVRRNTPIRGSVDNDYINPAIIRVQDTRVAYVLGGALMGKLQRVKAGEPDEGDNRYAELTDSYVAKYIWWEVCYALLSDISVHIGQNGVEAPSSNQGNAVFEGTMAIVKNNIIDGVNSYKRLLLNYLCMNSGKFKEYGEFSTQKKEDNGQPFYGVHFY